MPGYPGEVPGVGGNPVSLVIDIPGWRVLELEHLVLDLNGTLALDGSPLPGVSRAVAGLASRLRCHLVTADTFGTAAELFGPAVELARITAGDEERQKLEVVQGLDPERVVALGNGANDVAMLRRAALGIAVLGPEGACAAALAAAEVVVPGPREGLELLLNPDRLRATLRR